MDQPLPRPARSMFAWPALLATVFLLILLLGGYTLLESVRLQSSLSRELEERAQALIGVLQATGKNAVTSNALLEELIAQRLLDNARFIDFLAGRGSWAQALIRRVVRENRLAKVEFLDSRGRPIQLPEWPAVGRGPERPGPPSQDEGAGVPESGGMQGMGPGMMAQRGERPPPMAERMPREWQGRGIPFMWGSRWGGMRGNPAALFPSLPKEAEIRRFWEGSDFGVAVPAQNFAGIVAVHADAETLLNFRKEVGLQRLIEELGRERGVLRVTLLDPDLTILAASEPAEIGRREADPFLKEVRESKRERGRHLSVAGREAYQIVTPFALDARRIGLLRLDLGSEGMLEAGRATRRSILFYSAGLLLAGVAGVVAIFWVQARHAAERRALEAAMVREQRLSAMGNLAAGVAHEIRNPLNAIAVGLQRLGLEFAPAEPAAREEYTGFVRILREQVARLNSLIEQFLTLARPLKLSLAAEPVGRIVDEVAALLGPQADGQGIRIERGGGADGSLVRMDRATLQQALLNIALNGLQAMPGGGVLSVQIESKPPENRVRIVVADRGPGIPPADLDRIFEPYFTTKEGGTGLGLALARKIVREHGGDILAANGPGGGAVFTISLPAAEDGRVPRDT
ncbi:MAG: ATP-binding protein [Candidatus Methylomirabilota bacterium]